MRVPTVKPVSMFRMLVASVLLVAHAPASDAQVSAADSAGSEATVGELEGSDVDGGASVPPPPAGVEVLVITGQRRRGSIVDASQAATTFDAVELEALGVVDIGDLAASTPSLEIRKASSTTATFFIRGVGLNDFAANASGSVAIYQDDVPLNLPAIQSGLIYDVQDVQVLKGPQGSGPGRNASAGAIKTVSRKPTGEFSSTLRFDYGNFDFIDAEGALEIPLVEDILSTRMSFRVVQRDGYVKNRCGGLTLAEIQDPSLIGSSGAPGSPCGNQVDVKDPVIVPGLPEFLNDRNTWAARAHLRFVPPEIDMDWTLSVHGSKIDQLGNVGEPLGALEFLGSTDLLSYKSPEVSAEQAAIAETLPQPFTKPQCKKQPDRAACLANRDAINQQRQEVLSQHLRDRPLDTKPFEGDYNLFSFERMITYGGFLRGEWELPKVTLLSISGFERYDRDRLIDADYTPNKLNEFSITDNAWQFSQDLRASGELERYPVTWGTGGYYLMEVLDFEQSTLLQALSNVDQFYRQETWSVGIYGEFSWEFLDDFTLDGGLRYNWERKSVDAQIFLNTTNACRPTTNANGTEFFPDCDVTASFGAPTGTLGITYDFNDQVSSYWKYSRGWKGPQINVRDGRPPLRVVDVANPEIVDAFEVGFKGLWLDDRLSLQGAAFWYNYQDYQVFVTTNDVGTPSQRIVINANDAQIYGIELEMGLEPVEALQLDLRFGWLESKFLNFTDTGTVDLSDINDPDGRPLSGFSQVVIDYNNNRLPNAPRFKLSGNATYTYDLGRYGALIPRYDFSWTDDVFFDPSEGRGAPNNDNEIFLPELTIGQAAYVIHSVRLTYQAPSGNISIAGWVRNFTNEVYKVAAFDQTRNANMVGNLLGLPRTFGVSAKVDF